MWLLYECRNKAWDGNGGFIKTKYKYQGYATLVSHAELVGNAVGDLVVWLRGGGTFYAFASDNTISVSVYYSNTNLGSSDYPVWVGPKTEIGNGGVTYDTPHYGNIIGTAWKAEELLPSSGSFNQGSWNGPTRGLVTQIGDNSGAQHSVIVGLKSDSITRAYGIDFLDSDSYQTMRLYAGNGFLELLSDGSVECNGLLRSTRNGNTVTIGSQNSSWCHIYNSANIPFYFNKDIYVNGYRCLTSLDLTGGVSSLKLGDLYVSGANAVAVTSGAGRIYLGSGGEYSGITTMLRGNNVRIYAHDGGAVYLGYSGSTAVTSDENLKDIYEIDDKYLEFFKNLKPITYIYKNLGHRNHIGFGARQVEEALTKAGLTTEQFAGVLKDKDITISADEMGTEEDVFLKEMYSLRYEEFIALNTYMIQKQAKQIEEQNNLIADLKARIEILEKQADIC